MVKLVYMHKKIIIIKFRQFFSILVHCAHMWSENFDLFDKIFN